MKLGSLVCGKGAGRKWTVDWRWLTDTEGVIQTLAIKLAKVSDSILLGFTMYFIQPHDGLPVMQTIRVLPPQHFDIYVVNIAILRQV